MVLCDVCEPDSIAGMAATAAVTDGTLVAILSSRAGMVTWLASTSSPFLASAVMALLTKSSSFLSLSKPPAATPLPMLFSTFSSAPTSIPLPTPPFLSMASGVASAAWTAGTRAGSSAQALFTS
ncbi:hypothetical protein BC831DRAFT_467350 [Entophlyctis helioformis]|nr:hypothetical protein BC831DRAFT_467350 [Entophlyctis helioformis]